MKKYTYVSCIIISIICLLTGCTSKEESYKKGSITDIKEEYDTFEYKGNNFQIENEKIAVPDVNKIYSVEFDVNSKDATEIEECFIQNLKKLMSTDDVNTNNINYYLPNSKNGSYTIVPMKEATSDVKNNRNAYLIYFDGKYQEILYKTSMMCELGCNIVPKKYSENIDFSSMWTHIGLDLGTEEDSYNVLDEDISDVKYNLSDGEYYMSDAIKYVEKHIKDDYYFVGSEILDYSVYQAAVRKLADGIYYYQFKVKAAYKGVSLNKDEAIYDNTNLNGESHIVSVFTKDSIGYIWSCCHSYQKVKQQKAVNDLISLKEACSIVEKELTSKMAFNIDSMEMLYLTEFKYDKDDISVESVKCIPCYHFYVSNPGLAGYSTLCFDVNAMTGKFLVGRQ